MSMDMSENKRLNARFTPIKESEVAGKTVLALVRGYSDGNSALFFTDGTVAVYQITQYEDSEFVNEAKAFRVGDFSGPDLVKAKLYTQEEVRGYEQRRQEAWREECKIKERQEFERLKAKFEAT